MRCGRENPEEGDEDKGRLRVDLDGEEAEVGGRGREEGVSGVDFLLERVVRPKVGIAGVCIVYSVVLMSLKRANLKIPPGDCIKLNDKNRQEIRD